MSSRARFDLRPVARLLGFEHLEPRELLAIDFGDAPAPYPTLLAENGAQHEAIGPTLGALRDTEANGIHSSAADADGADEDGVTFGTIRVGQLGASVTVNVQSAPSGAKLDAWIDFDADGNWGGPLEQIANFVTLANGDNVITFDVPSSAADGTTFARFRLSTAGNLGVAGLALDGEVEDYAVTIDSSAAAFGTFGAQNTLTTAANGAWAISAADIDGDGDMDLLSGSVFDDKVRWYENNGAEVFETYEVAGTTVPPSTVRGPRSVMAGDVDGDGDLDVLSASYKDDRIAWYENDGSPVGGVWTARNINTPDPDSDPANGTNGNANGASSVYAADIDGDGDLDVLSASFYDDRIAWYENRISTNESWVARNLFNGADGAFSVHAADIDGDGDLDVVSASLQDDTVAWYVNDGTPANGGWLSQEITTALNDARSVYAADVDRDGDTDLVAGGGSVVVWLESDGTPADGGWTTRTITSTASGVMTIYLADMDGDGDLDALSAAQNNDNKVAWYENDGTPASGDWASHTITSPAIGTIGVYAADVDGDGDMDAMSASWIEHKVAWYENLAMDFGDAPAPYPTLSTEHGARHEPEGPTLGSLRDTDGVGAHSTAADADGADEDGVTFGALQVGKLGATVTVNVQNAPSGAKLDAWIDFDGDGSWGGPLEQFANSVSVVNGDNVLTLDVPSSAVDGVTFARFRLSTAGNLGFFGPAADGEVEDHAVTIDTPDAATGNFGGQNVIYDDTDGAWGVSAADIDGDGDMDLLSISLDDVVRWYENNGGEIFAPHVVTTSVAWARSVLATDVDGDGDLDVLIASYTDDTIAWFENDGTPAGDNWTARVIGTTANGASGVYAADLDGDGDLDVLSASIADSAVSWYENDGTPGDGGWTGRDITTAANGAFCVHAADIDGDGDTDVVSSSLVDDDITWYENDGTPARGTWTARDIDTLDFPTSVQAADVDGDGDTDIVSLSKYDDLIVWLENDGSPTNGGWTPKTISTTAAGAFTVYAADMDGDGDLDVLCASQDDNTIAWYTNDGSPANDASWMFNTISTAAVGATGVYAADVDGDGDLDAISASLTDYKVAWYENQNPSLADYNVDGDVDNDDYEYWTTHFAENSDPGLTADGNGDLVVDAADYVVWRKIYGNGVGSSGAASSAVDTIEVAAALSEAKLTPENSESSTPVSPAPQVSGNAPTFVLLPHASRANGDAAGGSANSARRNVLDHVFQRWTAPRIDLLFDRHFERDVAAANPQSAPFFTRHESARGADDDSSDAAFDDLECLSERVNSVSRQAGPKRVK
jgi:hypothetical protein